MIVIELEVILEPDWVVDIGLDSNVFINLLCTDAVLVVDVLGADVSGLELQVVFDEFIYLH